jgi:lactoylglutathione lyase
LFTSDFSPCGRIAASWPDLLGRPGCLRPGGAATGRRTARQAISKTCASGSPDAGVQQGEEPMKYLHTMVRVTDIDASLKFYGDGLGFKEVRRSDNEKGRYTLIFLSPTGRDEGALIELTYNWDPEVYTGGRNFGHLAIGVDNIYDFCKRLQDMGITINRPPRDGHMAFVRSPDNISVEIIQQNGSLPAQEPWASMANTGSW